MLLPAPRAAQRSEFEVSQLILDYDMALKMSVKYLKVKIFYTQSQSNPDRLSFCYENVNYFSVFGIIIEIYLIHQPGTS